MADDAFAKAIARIAPDARVSDNGATITVELAGKMVDAVKPLGADHAAAAVVAALRNMAARLK